MQKRFRKRCATLILCLPTLILTGQQQVAAQEYTAPAPGWWPFGQIFKGLEVGQQGRLDDGRIGSDFEPSSCGLPAGR